MITLTGGWGYYNMGDEALLAAYRKTLEGIDELRIASVDPVRTARAHGLAEVDREAYFMRPAEGPVVVCGGGYLNGRWRPELPLKLRRLRRLSRHGVIGHALEMRRLDAPSISRSSRALFSGHPLAVRDTESAAQAARLGLAADIVPDAIAMLAPHVGGLRKTVPQVVGKYVLNLVDIAKRSDSSDSEVAPQEWLGFCKELISRIGSEAVAIVAGHADREFARNFGIPLIEPSSVRSFISILGSARAVLSVRMHPALIASMLGVPTLAVPYNGKVSPTLGQIGIESIVLRSLDVDLAIQSLSSSEDLSGAWSAAAERSSSWLLSAVERQL
ncbi:polysaccharide pyruvyl transferase family protein [Protaetiibacter intestinalis]|nr:polysaccharide pyruvyl transferase family protein [Protaetiibacter intestinalis]